MWISMVWALFVHYIFWKKNIFSPLLFLDYRVCERRGCPDNSNCTNTISGPICRCEVGQFLLQGRECVKGDYFIKVRETWSQIYIHLYYILPQPSGKKSIRELTRLKKGPDNDTYEKKIIIGLEKRFWIKSWTKMYFDPDKNPLIRTILLYYRIFSNL